jgi:predicted DNA-binding transcriptional regulator AlpA
MKAASRKAATGGAITPATLAESQAAEYVGMSLSWLRSARFGVTKAAPPPHIRIGRSIRYRRADLDAWLNALPTIGIVPRGAA